MKKLVSWLNSLSVTTLNRINDAVIITSLALLSIYLFSK